MERLQKVIAASGITSRRKAEQYITQGRVRVNGEVVTQLGTQVKKGDVIEVDGEVIARENKVYYLMNKPKKTLCASSDDRGRQTVIDLMECEERVFTVGRLDYDTSGALLITNDGEFANRIMHPSHEITKTYHTWVRGDRPEQAVEKLRLPMELDGYVTRPAEAEILKLLDGGALLSISIHEGRNRQVRKMCQAVGLRVTRLKRVAEGTLELGGLAPGKWRHLSAEELEKLR